MPPLGDLAFSVVVTIIAISVTVAFESVSDNNNTVVESASRALCFREDTAIVKLEFAIDSDSDRDWLLFQLGKHVRNIGYSTPSSDSTNLLFFLVSACTFCL